MPELTSTRYIGIDLGTTNSSVCTTRYNSGRGQFDDPEPVQFENKPTLRSLLLLNPAGDKVEARGDAVYRHLAYQQYPERVHEEFKLRLEQDPAAATYTRLLAGELAAALRRKLGATEIVPDLHQTSVGVPAEWILRYPTRCTTVQESVAAAGFPNVEIVAEPVAAMLYHAFLGDVVFESRPQRWLILDIGGGTTDLAIVETAEAGAQPRVIHTFGRNFGGKDFDMLLLEKWVLAEYWSGSSPNPQERLALLQFVRDFKEQFSRRVSRGIQEGWVPEKMGHAQNYRGMQISLNRQEFEDDNLGRPLIDRFAGVLRDGFVRSQVSLRDIDRVILTGGSARWYFIQEAASSFFGQKACIISENPELTIVKGLALARTDFQRHYVVILEPGPESELQSKEPLPDPVAETSTESVVIVDKELEAKFGRWRDQAKTIYKQYSVGGGVFAILVAPIPGASQLALTALEVKLVTDIAEVYGFKLEKEEIVTVIGGLLAGGTVIKAGVMTVAEFAPGIGWVVKGGAAAGAIAALGDAATKYFENKHMKIIAAGGESL